MVALAAQGLDEVQVAPWLHAVHAPPAPQTPLPPPDGTHDVPGVLKVWSVQTGAPLVHTMEAVASQGFDDVQAVPAAHAVQAPLVPLHTPATPPEVQPMPAAVKVLSTQTGPPVEQSTVAVAVHGLLDVHAAPGLQALQVWLLSHTPVPPPGGVQSAPVDRNAVSVHTGAPLEQAMAALVAHGFVDVQAAPTVQAAQVPLALQTPDGQPLPGGRKA